MFGKIFEERPTTRVDLAMAVFGAVFAVFKAIDTTHKYQLTKTNEIQENNS